MGPGVWPLGACVAADGHAPVVRVRRAALAGERSFETFRDARVQQQCLPLDTPDPGGRKVVKLDDPQTWNMYAYVGNNPTSRNDPSGLVVQCSSDSGKKDAAACQQIIDIANQRDKKGNYVNPKLHSIYDRLNRDKRVFTIENAKLARGTVGLFTLRGINYLVPTSPRRRSRSTSGNLRG